MGKGPRTGLAAGLLGIALGMAGSAEAQTPSPQSPPPASYSTPRPPGKGAARATASPQAGLPQGPRSAAACQGVGTGVGQSGAGAAGSAGGTAPPDTGGAAGDPGAGGAASGLGDAAGAAPGLDAGGAGGNPALSSGLGGTASGAETFFGMLGDQPPISRLTILQRPGVPRPPPLPNPGVPPVPPVVPRPFGRARAVAVLPSVRGFKISENQSPQPQDRVYYSFNYYSNLNQAVNERVNSQIDHLKVYRHVFGVEKTFQEGRGSVGLRLPLDSLTTTSALAGFGGTSYAAGDLAVIVKYALLQDRDAGRLISAGLLVNTPTGPRNFANGKGIRSPHNAALQPFVGFIKTYGDLYFQGFSAVDVPTNPNDVTLMYNDLGVGYYLYKAPDLDRLITAVAPTFEVHVNTPLNHRDPYNLNDLAGTYDFVNLTMGSNFQIRRNGLLALAVVAPVTGPQPFHIETVVQFNLRF